jgi:transcriptional regulator with XRE-family HTH domain
MGEKEENIFPYGSRLREERKRLGKTQEELAAIGGVTTRTQRTYEAGRRVPDSKYLNRLAAAGVDVNYILTETETWWRKEGRWNDQDNPSAVYESLDCSAQHLLNFLGAHQAAEAAATDIRAIREAGRKLYQRVLDANLSADESVLLESYRRLSDIGKAKVQAYIAAAQEFASASQQVTGNHNIQAGGDISGTATDTPPKGIKKKKGG